MLQTRIHLDSNGQDLAIEHFQDCEPIVELAKVRRTMDETNTDGLKEIAEIPYVKLIELLDEQHAKGNTSFKLFSPECNRLIRHKLYFGDWAYLRTDKPALQAGWSAGLL